MSFFFYFIEKVFSWKEIIIPMLSVSFESSLIWYSERGQTSIFITHSKCHFHAAISFTSYFSTLHVKKKKSRIKPRSTWKDVARVFEAVHDDIFRNNWEACLVSKEGWGVPDTQEPCPPPDVTTKVNLCPKAHTAQFLLIHCHGCEGAFSSAQAAGAAWAQSRESKGLGSSLHAVPQDCCQ